MALRVLELEHYRKTKQKLENIFLDISRNTVFSKENRTEWESQVRAYRDAQENLVNSLTNKEEIDLFKSLMADLNNPKIDIAEKLNANREKHGPFIEKFEEIVRLDSTLRVAIRMLSALAVSLNDNLDFKYHTFESNKIQKGFLYDSLFDKDKQSLIEGIISKLTFLKTVSGITALEANILFLNNALNRPPPTKRFLEKIPKIISHVIKSATLCLSHIRFDRKVNSVNKPPKRPGTE